MNEGFIPRIPISWLNHAGYCEGQLVFLARGIEPKRTKKMVDGSAMHENKYIEHSEKAELKIPISEAIIKAKKENTILISREVLTGSKVHNLIGSIDELTIYPDCLEVSDDKPITYPYFSAVLQVWGYCLCVEESYEYKNPIIAVIKNIKTNKIIYKQRFGELEKKEVIDSINRISGIISGKIEPKITNNPTKCLSCGYRAICHYKIQVESH